MSILNLLTDDHIRITNIFEELEDAHTTDLNIKEKLFSDLLEELSIHTISEEKVFYAHLKRFRETGVFLPDAFEDHNDIKEIIDELEKIQKNNFATFKLLSRLKRIFIRHIEKEENKVFPIVRKYLSDEELQEMAIYYKIERDKFRLATIIR